MAPRSSSGGSVTRLARDAVTVVVDAIWWVWTRFWRFTREVVRVALPGQPRVVHTGVTALLVLAEIVALWVVLSDWARRH